MRTFILATALLALAASCLASTSTTVSKCPGLSISATPLAPSGQYFAETRGSKYDAGVGAFYLTITNSGPYSYEWNNHGITFNATFPSVYDLVGPAKVEYLLNLKQATALSFVSNSDERVRVELKTTNKAAFEAPDAFSPGQSNSNYIMIVRAETSVDEFEFAITNCRVVQTAGTTGGSRFSSTTTTGSSTPITISTTTTTGTSTAPADCGSLHLSVQASIGSQWSDDTANYILFNLEVLNNGSQSFSGSVYVAIRFTAYYNGQAFVGIGQVFGITQQTVTESPSAGGSLVGLISISGLSAGQSYGGAGYVLSFAKAVQAPAGTYYQPPYLTVCNPQPQQ